MNLTNSLRNPHSLLIEDILGILETNPQSGLKPEIAKIRLNNIGSNEIVTPTEKWWKLYLAPLMDTLIVIYLIMTSVLLFLAFFVDGIIGKVAFWVIIIFINMGIAIFQQFRAQKQLSALRNLSSPESIVIRGGEKLKIRSSKIIPGDLIYLEAGVKIPCDLRIIKSNNLRINEASLTGESVSVSKNQNKKLKSDLPLSERTNMLYLGTFVQTGNCYAVAVHTGNNTELGKIALEIGNLQSFEIPLRSRVNEISKVLGMTMIVFLVFVFTHQLIVAIRSGEVIIASLLAEILVKSIINAMSVMPITIPLLTTVVLLTGVLNMAKNKVIIKELSVIETLGRCSVLCSDKTGTITTSKMSVKLLWDTHGYYSLEKNGSSVLQLGEYNHSNGLIDLDCQQNRIKIIESISSKTTLENLVVSSILNNDASYGNDGMSQMSGNPTDAALLELKNELLS